MTSIELDVRRELDVVWQVEGTWTGERIDRFGRESVDVEFLINTILKHVENFNGYKMFGKAYGSKIIEVGVPYMEHSDSFFGHIKVTIDPTQYRSREENTETIYHQMVLNTI
jgi:hypothetical protein